MIDGLVFPDVRECLRSLVEGTTHLGKPVRFVQYMQADAYGSPLGPFPVILATVTRGNEGYIDRMDSVTLECWADDTDAAETLESVKAWICGTDIDTANGYLDAVAVDQTPTVTPYQSDALNQASMTLTVITRPL